MDPKDFVDCPRCGESFHNPTNRRNTAYCICSRVTHYYSCVACGKEGLLVPIKHMNNYYNCYHYACITCLKKINGFYPFVDEEIPFTICPVCEKTDGPNSRKNLLLFDAEEIRNNLEYDARKKP